MFTFDPHNAFDKTLLVISWHLRANKVPAALKRSLGWLKYSTREDYSRVVVTKDFELYYDEEEGLKFVTRGKSGVKAVAEYAKKVLVGMGFPNGVDGRVLLFASFCYPDHENAKHYESNGFSFDSGRYTK